jgi:hypothetical protein
MALPLRQSTLRESPALDTIIFFLVRRTTLAVHPVLYPILFSPMLVPSFFLRIIRSYYYPYLLWIRSSTRLNVSTIAYS